MLAFQARSISDSVNARKSAKYVSIKSYIAKNVQDGKTELWINSSEVPELVVQELRKEGYQVTYERSGTVIKW